MSKKSERGRKESLRRLMEVVSSDELPEVVATATVIVRQERGLPSESWSLGNRMIMVLNNTQDARAFKQWESVGRHPKKGSKSFYILTPNKRKIRELDEESGEEVESIVIRGFGVLPVFRYEDTEGDPLELPDYSPITLPPLHKMAQRLDVGVDYAPAEGGTLGFYLPGKKHITLMSHDERVFFHELAHAADERVSGPLRGVQDPVQEVVAETVAATLCLMYGLDGYVPQSKEYIESYALLTREENAHQAVLRVFPRVEKALDLILGPEPPHAGAYVIAPLLGGRRALAPVQG